MCVKYCIKPGSYFLRMRMRSEFDVNLTSQLSFRSNIRKWVAQSWTAANIRNIRILIGWDSNTQSLQMSYQIDHRDFPV